MTIAILRRLLQILTFLAALALVVALARVVPAIAPSTTVQGMAPGVHADSRPPVAGMPLGAARGRAERGVPDLVQLRPTPRAWHSAGTALAATAVLVVPAAALALLAGLLAGVWGATAVAASVRSAVAILSAAALAVPAFLTARFAASAVGPVPEALLALLAGNAGDVSWLALLASPAALACILVLAVAVTPGIVDATSAQLRAASSAPWMRFARAQGIPRTRIVAALLRPLLIVTAAGLAWRVLALLLALACVVENVIGWPGIGHLLVASIAAGDLPVASACFAILAAATAVSRGIALGAARALDPRPKGSA